MPNQRQMPKNKIEKTVVNSTPLLGFESKSLWDLENVGQNQSGGIIPPV